MLQSEIDKLMTPSKKKNGEAGQPIALKSRLGPREIRTLGHDAQVWGVRIFGTVPAYKNAKALELHGVALVNGQTEIFIPWGEFPGATNTPSKKAQPEKFTVEDIKAGKQKPQPQLRKFFYGVRVADFVDVLLSRLPGVTEKTRLLLVCFGAAENYGPLNLHDLDSRLEFLPQGGNAYRLQFFEEREKITPAGTQKKRKCRLELMDLGAFFPDQELGEVAANFGRTLHVWEPKRPREDDAGAYAYALEQARTVWGIFAQLRGEMVGAWGVDPAVYKTPASCALGVYAGHFLGRAVGPVRAQIRTQAMRCYWGGRIEAFFRGRFTGEVCGYDAVSLYPQAAINLGAMPTGESWYRLNMSNLHTCTGGLCTVEFEFPKDELHPCLPVNAGGKTYFPLTGTSHCTVHEVRYALELGAQIFLWEGWGYDAENSDTSLAQFSADLLRRKNEADAAGNYAARTMQKLMMNSLYGKFASKSVGHSLETLRRVCREYGYPDVFTLLKIPNWPQAVLERTGEVIEEEINVSDSWCPEWTALINGYARYIESKAMREYVALTGTIDSVILSGDAGPEFEIDGVTFRREFSGDTLVSVRARLYAVTNGAEIVKTALHGAPQVDGVREKLAAWKGEEEITVYAQRTRQLREGITGGQVVGARILSNARNNGETEKFQRERVGKNAKRQHAADMPHVLEMGWDNRRELTQDYSTPFPEIVSRLSAEQLAGLG